ncbi:unnamed protein product [Urochloa humidicola]
MEGDVVSILRVHMRGQTAQMSLLTLHHLSVTSPIQFSSNQNAETARQLVRQHDRDPRRDLVLALLKNTRKRKCSKRTGQEGWGLGGWSGRTAASGLNE